MLRRVLSMGPTGRPAAPPATAALQEPSSKRILVLGSYAPSLINFRGPLIALLVARGHEVVAAAPSIDPGTEAALFGYGAKPVSIPLSNASLSPAGMLEDLRGVKAMIRNERPDVIISYTIKPVILGAIAAKSLGVPHIVSLVSGLGLPFTEGGGLKRTLLRVAASILYRAAFSRSDLVLFQNPDDPQLMRRLRVLPRRAPFRVVDGSGVDLDRFTVAARPERPAFLMVARLIRDKGVREYAAAASRLRKLHPEASTALVGYLDPSPGSITESELQDIVSGGMAFHGKVEDVRPVVASSCVFVLPSYYREGIPRSVLEAMAMGRAVIATDSPGCRETVIDGVNGFLVEPRSVESLFAAMKRFVDDPDLARRMGAESRKIVEKRFDARKVAADILRHAGL